MNISCSQTGLVETIISKCKTMDVEDNLEKLKKTGKDDTVELLGKTTDGNVDTVTMLGKTIDSNEEMMYMLQKNPKMQSMFRNMLNNLNVSTLEENISSTPDNGGELLADPAQMQTVMSQCVLPENNPSYTVNTATCSSPQSCEMPLAMPDECILEEKTLVDCAITEESSTNDSCIGESEKTSIDFTFAPDDLILSSNLFSNIMDSSVPSELLDLDLDSEELHVFCTKINSPDHNEFSEVLTDNIEDDFENSNVQNNCSHNELLEPAEFAVVSPNNINNPSDYITFCKIPSDIRADASLQNSLVQLNSSPNDIVASPEYAVLSKSSASPPEWDGVELHKNIESSSSSFPSNVFLDSDLENVAREIQRSPLSFDASPDCDSNMGTSDSMDSDISGSLYSAEYGLGYNQSDENIFLVGDDNNCLSSNASPLSVDSSIIDMDPHNYLNNSAEFESWSDSSDSSIVCIDNPLSTAGCMSDQSLLALTNFTRASLTADLKHEEKQIEFADDNQEGSAKKRRKMDMWNTLEGDHAHSELSKHNILNNTHDIEFFNIICTDNTYNCIQVGNPVFRRDDEGELPLHIAVQNEDVESVEEILHIMHGMEVNSKNLKQQTPLHIACYTDNVAIMWLLLQSGANPQITDAYGDNMMHIGCLNSSTKILDVLECYYMKYPSKVVEMLNVHNYKGLTPLHVVTRRGDMDIINRLVHTFNCDLDIKDLKRGMTVLLYTLEAQDWGLAGQLVSYGALLNEPNHAGMKALDYVAISDNLDLAKELISRDAEVGVKSEFVNDEMKGLFMSELRKRRRRGTKRSPTAGCN